MADREEEEDALHPHLLTDPLLADMDSLQLFLDQFQSRSEAVSTHLHRGRIPF